MYKPSWYKNMIFARASVIVYGLNDLYMNCLIFAEEAQHIGISELRPENLFEFKIVLQVARSCPSKRFSS